MQEILTANELMTPHPLTVPSHSALTQVYGLMIERGIRHVPVVDRDGHLEGIVSHRDLVRHALFAFDDLSYSEQRYALQKISVDQIMTRDPETVGIDTPLEDAARLLLDNKFGCVPVVEGDKLVGIITEADFVKHMLIGAGGPSPAPWE